VTLARSHPLLQLGLSPCEAHTWARTAPSFQPILTDISSTVVPVEARLLETHTTRTQNTQIRADAPESSPVRYNPGLGYAVEGIFRPMRPRAPQQCGSASSCLQHASKKRPPPGPPQDHQRLRSECVPCGQRGSARRGRKSRLPGGGISGFSV